MKSGKQLYFIECNETSAHVNSVELFGQLKHCIPK